MLAGVRADPQYMTLLTDQQVTSATRPLTRGMVPVYYMIPQPLPHWRTATAPHGSCSLTDIAMFTLQLVPTSSFVIPVGLTSFQLDLIVPRCSQNLLRNLRNARKSPFFEERGSRRFRGYKNRLPQTIITDSVNILERSGPIGMM